jgi:hypothetical protein
MFATVVRAEIALGGDDSDAGLRLWRAAAAGLRDPRCQDPGGGLSSLQPWALEVQGMAVIAHTQHGRLAQVAQIADALPAALAVLTADPGLPGDTPAASYPGLSVWGTLLLALAMADLNGAGCPGGERAVSPGARMIALAGRFGFQHHGFPTLSAGRDRQAAQVADGAAYADAVPTYAGLGPEALHAATRTALAARVQVSGLGPAGTAAVPTERNFGTKSHARRLVRAPQRDFRSGLRSAGGTSCSLRTGPAGQGAGKGGTPWQTSPTGGSAPVSR